MRKNYYSLFSNYAICMRIPGAYFVSFNNVRIPEKRIPLERTLFPLTRFARQGRGTISSIK